MYMEYISHLISINDDDGYGVNVYFRKTKFYAFKSTFYCISFVSNFKSNMTMISNTDRSTAVMLIAPTTNN